MTSLDTIYDDVPKATSLVDIIVKLADEGVPLYAVARATDTAPEIVRAVLQRAQSGGRLVEMPKDDWPPGKSRAERIPEAYTGDTTDENLVMTCAKVFKVTRLQARLLLVIIKRPQVHKSTLHQVVEQGRDPLKDQTDQKIVDVVVCHIRKKMEPFFEGRTGRDIIKTRWSFGYYMEPEDRKRANELLGVATVDTPQAA